MRRWRWFTTETSNRELRRDFLASPGEVERENERTRCREEWRLRAHLSTGLSQKGVIEDKCKSLLCIVYSVCTTSSSCKKFLLVCRNYLPISQQITREGTCCDSPKASGVSSHSPDVIKFRESGAVRTLQWSTALFDSVFTTSRSYWAQDVCSYRT